MLSCAILSRTNRLLVLRDLILSSVNLMGVASTRAGDTTPTLVVSELCLIARCGLGKVELVPASNKLDPASIIGIGAFLAALVRQVLVGVDLGPTVAFGAVGTLAPCIAGA